MARRLTYSGAPIRQISQDKLVSIPAAMRAATFCEGFEDAKRGRAPKEYRKMVDAWSYERGRLFACIWPFAAYKRGTRVMPEAVSRMNEAIQTREIF